MQILKFHSLDEAIERSNKTKYGLGAAVNTTNVERALQYAHGVRAGTVWYEWYIYYLKDFKYKILFCSMKVNLFSFCVYLYL